MEDKKTNTELTKEEVNIYMADCGSLKMHCLSDCVIIDPIFISSDN